MYAPANIHANIVRRMVTAMMLLQLVRTMLHGCMDCMDGQDDALAATRLPLFVQGPRDG